MGLNNIKLNLYFNGQQERIEKAITDNFSITNITTEKVGELQRNLQSVSLNRFYLLVLKVANFVIKIFREYDAIDKLLKTDLKTKLLLDNLYSFISLDKINSYNEIVELIKDRSVLEAVFELRKLQIEKCIDELEKGNLENHPYLKQAIPTLIKFKDNNADINKDELIKEAKDELKQLLNDQIKLHDDRDSIKLKADDFLIQMLTSPISEQNPYHVSVSSLEKEFKDDVDKPITVTMIGVEYTGLVKQGGLAEALEGLSQGILKQNSENKVNLIFPKFSNIPSTVEMTPFKTCTNNEVEFKVYRAQKDGVDCYFIEHEAFNLKDSPSIYGPTATQQAERFAIFSKLAASFVSETENIPDIIHIHDWHAAGVALSLRNQKDQWSNGEVPPILFTFHNNNRVSQGRLEGGVYSNDGMAQAYMKHGITQRNENLFAKTIEIADGVTTVSNGFAIEAQQEKTGEGVSWAVRLAAKVGKFFGILNGSSPGRWNPETDKDLQGLNYGTKAGLENKENCKTALGTWITTYKEGVTFDPTKPIVTYIGRFDSYQKGLDKLDEAIQATLDNGGQFICMGSQEDESAKKILDYLENKYKQGVLFIRDEKKDGKFRWQQGEGKRPPVGSLVRAASDFVFIPSRFEPCGLVQFEGWLFGSLAIGANTGGLADTIKTKGDHFNGYLFERDGDDQTASMVIAKALTDWKVLCENTEEKNKLLTRVMVDAQKCGWNDSPEGPTQSAVHKYRLVYANTIKRAKNRGKTEKFNAIDALRRRFIDAPSTKQSLEEQYLEAFHKGNDRDKLINLYYQLHETQRIQVPNPFGKQVNCSKYQEFGSFYFKDKTYFTVEAPNADKVRVCFYDDEGKIKDGADLKKYAGGVWECEVLNLRPGQMYRYEVNGILKIDPYGRQTKRPDVTEAPFSVVVDPKPYGWGDQVWMGQKPKPQTILEVLPSVWKEVKTYEALATKLIGECQKNNYSHVELMGILDHPDERSWGYQVTGYFSPNNRLGTPEDFKRMVDRLHQANIGVVLDWVPAHFAVDNFGLAEFDKTDYYESNKPADVIRSVAFGFGSKHFDFSKKEVREFLLSSAAFWLKEMHIDGIRVDCVRSILNAPDQKTAQLFLKDFNALVQGERGFTIAEDYSGDTKVTMPFHSGGLGFDMKWNTALIAIFKEYENSHNYDDLKRAIEAGQGPNCNFLSHDDLKQEINHHKWTNDQQKRFVQLMATVPGIKLHFMKAGYDCSKQGWNVGGGTEAIELFDKMVSYLNSLSLNNRAFFQLNKNGQDIEWIEDKKKEVHAYRRKVQKGAKSTFTTLHNFGSNTKKIFFVPLEGSYQLEEIFNSSLPQFTTNTLIAKRTDGYTVSVPPGGTVIISEVKGD